MREPLPHAPLLGPQIFGLANFTHQFSVNHVLVVFELQRTNVPGLSRRLFPYVQRLPRSIPNIKILPRSAHLAMPAPTHVFPNLIMDVEIPTCVHERLRKTQRCRGVNGPCPRFQAKVRIERLQERRCLSDETRPGRREHRQPR